MDRRTVIAAGAALSGLALSGCATMSSDPKSRQQSIRPGELWLDTAGKPIQAHAGGLIAVGDDFYWYGENKEFTDGKQGIESWGIRFYRSRDLYNWEDLGALIAPDTSDPTSPLSPKVFPERPHILFNPRTRKFVCWIKIRGMGPKQFRTVMTADRITGPWKLVHRELRPQGMPAGDFDLLVDEKSGNGFMYFERDHKDVVCIELTDDWTDVTDRFSSHFPRKTPEVREAIACFQREDRIYMTSSGMTGYFPNPSEVAVARDPHGPFELLGDLHPTDASRTSFASQISYIFKHPHKRDLYIALADRWFPDVVDDPRFASGRLSELVRGAIIKATGTPRQPLTEEERGVVMKAAALTDVNTSISRYVWLPILFRDGRPTIEWRNEWRIEEFA
ncbi:family 43 glycosylhydrolase [Novosphingobium sp. RD2P27]|uniref:Family 43 glycosylhydrolase n=1 Tax=Novosphingobium kalidii TaxID=3230299 RepID=A0ABV2D0V9_9SPHN